MMRLALSVFVVSLGSSINTHAASATPDEDFLTLIAEKPLISIATGSAQSLTRAPAVATVITSEDIEAMGARDLDEVLESVPGLHVSRSSSLYNPIYIFRGIYSQYNPQVLMLQNGVPLTGSFVGDRSRMWAGRPVSDIARIEIVRGPGSALYGADAFAGVINIITKNARSIQRNEIGTNFGSFGTFETWTLQKGKWAGFDVAGFAQIGTTDGPNPTIDADAQTRSDRVFGTHASFAPAPIGNGRKSMDARVDINNQNWQLRLTYQKRWDIESGLGVASALDQQGTNNGERFLSDLTYQKNQILPNLDITTEASFYHISEESDIVVYPPGTRFPTGSFPTGVVGSPSKWEKHYRFAFSTYYYGIKDHKIRAGVGYKHDNLYKTRESKNYTLVFVPGVGNVISPLGSVVDVTDSAPFLRPHSRTVKYAYIQDEWTLAQDWYLTLGLRHDRYSDFGGTTNPRVALVWEAAYNLTTKLLYGRAFRAPSFAELYNINNPVALGNSDLKPERIDTIEAVVQWQATPRLNLGLSLFEYKMSDILAFYPNSDPTTGSTARNGGKQHGRGFELEGTWTVSPDLHLVGNYAFQHSIDETTHQDAGYAPHQQAYIRSDWQFAPSWLLDVQLNSIAGRKRVPGDTRPNVGDYQTVDLTLHRRKILNELDVAFTVKNIFDADAREPSPSPGLIPNDLPLAGRAFYLQLRYPL